MTLRTPLRGASVPRPRFVPPFHESSNNPPPPPIPRPVASAFGVAGLLALAILFASSSARAAEIRQATIGFGDTYVAGEWTFVRALVENQPDPKRPEAAIRDVKGELRLSVTDLEGRTVVFSREADLPRNSRKSLDFPVMLPEFGSSLQLDLVDASRGLAARHDLSGVFKTGANRRTATGVVPAILLDADANSNPTFPAGLGQAFDVMRGTLADLPSDARGYGGVRMVVTRRRPSETMSEAQLAALDAWIREGGRLMVVAPRAAGELALDAWLAERMPVVVRESRQTTLDAIAPGSPTDIVEVAGWGDPSPDAVEAWAGPEGPLAWWRRHGAGRVIALGVDPDGLRPGALKSPAGVALSGFLEAAAFAPVREDVRERHAWSTADVQGGFESVTILPNLFVVTFLLLGFVVVVGPLNFQYLKRAGRLELAWVTIPALSIVFFLAVYAYGSVAKGGRQIVTRVELAHVESGETSGTIVWSATQFSPARRTYEIVPPEGGDALPVLRFYEPQSLYARGFFGGMGVTPVAAEAGRPATARLDSRGRVVLSVPADQWKMYFYRGEEPFELSGAVTGRVVLSGNEARLLLRNDSEIDLEAATLFVGERSYAVGDVAAGESLDRPLGQPGSSAALATWWSGGAPSVAATDFRESAEEWLREGAFVKPPALPRHAPMRAVRLIARQDVALAGASVRPEPEEESRVSMIEVRLPLVLEGRTTLESRQGVPGGTLRVETIAFDPDKARFFDQPGMFGTVGESFIEVLIAPPELGASARFVDGTLELGILENDQIPSVSGFNYRTGEWERREFAGAGSMDPRRAHNQQTTTIQIPPDWVNPLGPHARIRIEARPVETDPNRQGRFFGTSGMMIQTVNATMTLEG